MKVFLIAQSTSFDYMEETENQEFRIRRLQKGEEYALVTQMLGTNKIRALKKDGKEILVHIPGKLNKRVWVREGDVIVILPWDFEPTKANLVWRYMGNQIDLLKRKGMLEGLPI